MSSLVSLGLFGLFVFSPLGSIFFSITNGLFLLAFSVPLVLFAGFTVFNTFFVVKADCPSCSTPAAALRGGECVRGGKEATKLC